jgi:hypothetical protein
LETGLLHQTPPFPLPLYPMNVKISFEFLLFSLWMLRSLSTICCFGQPSLGNWASPTNSTGVFSFLPRISSLLDSHLHPNAPLPLGFASFPDVFPLWIRNSYLPMDLGCLLQVCIEERWGCHFRAFWHVGRCLAYGQNNHWLCQ